MTDELSRSEASVKALARQTPHEHAVPADPYKSALICAICGLPRRHEIHERRDERSDQAQDRSSRLVGAEREPTPGERA